jgi:hypothetical protein
MDCKIQRDLVAAIVLLNNKLNLLSPDRVSEYTQVVEIEERRQALLVEMRKHRRKGHKGKPCPATPHASPTIRSDIK